jgi:hypothetical protein
VVGFNRGVTRVAVRLQRFRFHVRDDLVAVRCAALDIRLLHDRLRQECERIGTRLRRRFFVLWVRGDRRAGVTAAQDRKPMFQQACASNCRIRTSSS